MSHLSSIWAHAIARPDRPAIEVLRRDDGDSQAVGEAISYGALAARTAAAAAAMSGDGRRLRVGIVAANSPEYVFATLAVQLCGFTEIPVPLGFAPGQASHLLGRADLLVTDAQGRERLKQWRAGGFASNVPELAIDRLEAPPPSEAQQCWEDGLRRLAAGGDFVCKVIHTSGTTGMPKGVRIKATAVEVQVRTLAEMLGEPARRYLSILPLSLLIEQFCAIHVPLSMGGTLVLLPSDVPPFVGGPTAAADYLPQIRRAAAGFLMIPPAVVTALGLRHQQLAAGEAPDPTALARALFGRSVVPLIACGGAPTSRDLLDYLWNAGVPVYEGYGLSENTAVASWNAPQAFRRGTVGRPLPHIQAAVTQAGELVLRGPTICDGYDGEDSTSCQIDAQGWLHTGDIAEIDRDGFITLHGRIKNLAINSASRNISPEWVESVYRGHGAIREVVVFADGLESVVALVVPQRVDLSDAELEETVRAISLRHLPDYAQIRRFVRVQPDSGALADLFTITGRPRRDRVWAVVQQRLGEVGQ